MQTSAAVVLHAPCPVTLVPGLATLLVEHAGCPAAERVSVSSEGVDHELGRPAVRVSAGDEARCYYSHRLSRWVVLSVGADPDPDSLSRWLGEGGRDLPRKD